MKKFGKRFLIIAIVGVIGYVLYLVFLVPSGYTNKEQLTRDFITNMDSSTVCETYFNKETLSHCETFTGLFEGETVIVEQVTSSVNTINLTISVNGTSETFIVYFDEVEVTGVKGVFHSVYYRIDRIE